MAGIEAVCRNQLSSCGPVLLMSGKKLPGMVDLWLCLNRGQMNGLERKPSSLESQSICIVNLEHVLE